MFKKLKKNRFHLRFLINPYVRYKSRQIGDYSGVTDLKRSTEIVLSLTSFEERFEDLELVLYSLLSQTIKPDRIILWLSDKFGDLSILPYSIKRYIKNGLEIRFVKDIGSYTKIMYALKEFENSVIVTADDDIFYPKNWLEKLYHSYIANPKDIHCHRAHRVMITSDDIYPYECWGKHVKEESARFDNFLTGVGGVLYPPKCFVKEVFREDIFLNSAKTADDVWLWVMALLSDRKIRVVKNHIRTLICTNILRQFGGTKQKTLYSINCLGENDKQINNLMRYYKHNIMKKLESEK